MQNLITQRPTSPIPPSLRDEVPPTIGQRAAEFVASLVGSWRFIILQTCGIITWIVINATGILRPWDVYPFILMNLMLSLQAAYTAPMILMSQNRQAEKDRRILYGDYDLDQSTNEALLESLERMKRIEDLLAAQMRAEEARSKSASPKPRTKKSRSV